MTSIGNSVLEAANKYTGFNSVIFYILLFGELFGTCVCVGLWYISLLSYYWFISAAFIKLFTFSYLKTLYNNNSNNIL